MDFRHFELRTTNVSAARAFYEATVLSPFDGLVSELPGVARARGAPAHWLGHLHVDDPERALAAFLEAGAERLGPARSCDDGAPIIGLRDPFGAVVALTSRAVRAAERALPIHLSHDPDRARAHYSVPALFLPIVDGQTHSQWIFPIVVSNFDRAIERIREHGGHVLITNPRVAYAHDPQGAAFAIAGAPPTLHQA